MFVGKKCPKFLEYGVKVSLKSLNVNISSFWQSIYISSKLNYLPPQAELLWVMFSVFIFLWICLENCLCLWNKLLKYITFTQTIYFIISVCDYFIHEHCQVRILSNFWENPISIKIPSCEKERAPAMSVLIFVTQKPNYNFSLALLLTFLLLELNFWFLH